MGLPWLDDETLAHLRGRPRMPDFNMNDSDLEIPLDEYPTAQGPSSGAGSSTAHSARAAGPGDAREVPPSAALGFVWCGRAD